MIDMKSLLSLQGELFLLMALGFFFRRRGITGERFQKELADLIIDLVLPCNIIDSFLVKFDGELLRATSAVLLVSVAIQIGCWGLAEVLYRRQPESKRAVLQYGTICSNAGFLGTPVAEGIFGSQGLLLSAVYLIPQRVAMWTLGVSFFTRSTQEKMWKKVLLNPCIDAVFIGMVLLLTQVQLPAVLGNTIQAIGDSNTALSMFLIGMIIANIRWKDFIDPTILYYTVIRLGLIPLLTLLGCRLCGIGSLATNVSVVLATMPAGGTTAILAAKYGGNAEFAAGCVTVSTLFSLVAIPLWCLVL